MDRNTELHFASVPTIDISRCKLTKDHDYKSTWNTGDLIPVYVDDILPGTTVKMRMSEVVRMMTPIAPVADNSFMDIYWFFTPYRLIWDHWVNFMGQNDTEPWVMPSNFQIPQITCPEGGWAKGSLADYFGLPTKIYGNGWKCSVLPFRAYSLIWNEWFRDTCNKNPIYISKGDSDTTGKNKGESYDYVTDTECGAAPMKASKIHDYFTSCLRSAQRSAPVNVPLGNTAPVIFGEFLNNSAADNEALHGDYAVIGKGSGNEGLVYPYKTDGSSDASNFDGLKANNLFVDLSEAVGATVNQLRQAFAIQKFYERAARSGQRYIETLKAHFEVTNPDFRFQRPEYLGGKRIPINMNQVVQTDSTGKQLNPTYTDPENPIPDELIWSQSDTTPQGNLAAYSCTSDKDEDMWTHSFTEHGVLMCLVVCRTDRTYQQGLNRMWSRKSFFDFYWPELASIGEQAVLNKEIYLQGTSDDEEAFGYQEAWADYRYKPNVITGEMRSNYEQSLDIWHYGDDYDSLPTLSSDWIDEPKENVARTLAVQNHDQFFGDIFFSPIYTLPMPLYSVPGLIDHH